MITWMRNPYHLASAALCLIAPVVVVADIDLEPEPVGLVLQVASLLMMVPFIAPISLAVAASIQHIRTRIVKWLLLTLSLATAIDYARFALTANLTGSSTAGLALIFYPIMRQSIWALPLLMGLLLIGFVVDRREAKRPR